MKYHDHVAQGFNMLLVTGGNVLTHLAWPFYIIIVFPFYLISRFLGEKHE